MWNDMYKLAGTVCMSAAKRTELNGYVLQVLDKCGIRKTEEMKLDEKVVHVISLPKPNQAGIVSFDYSIFEKKKREIATYNMNTCELIVPDGGYREFEIAMNIIFVLLEAYSDSPCYLMYENKPAYVSLYAEIIRNLLGISLSFPNREKMWNMLLFLKNIEEYKDITGSDLWNSFPYAFGALKTEHAIAILDIDSKTIDAPKEPFTGKKYEIKDASKWSLKYYAFQTMKQLSDQNKGARLEVFLKELLDADMSERQKLAATDDEYGMIAEISLYILPAIIVQAYACAIEKEFWDTWNSLGIKGYSEINVKEKKAEHLNDEMKKIIPFYEIIQREHEDEFIEFWEEGNLNFSKKMKESFLDWKKQFKDMNPPEDMIMETSLAEIITDLEQDWNCRLVDKKFVIEFMNHADNKNYKKALSLYREIMDEDVAYFPELTRKQAVRWIIKDNRDKFDFIAMSAFQSLLTNHKHRLEILGF